MSIGRGVLLSAELVAICGVGMTPVSAQVDVVGVNGSRVVAEKPGQNPGLAHSSRHPARRRIELDMHRVTLKDALRAIAKLGGVELLYNDSDIPVERALTVTISDATVSQALAIVLHGTGLGARATADGIMIERREQGTVAEPGERQGSISGRVTDAQTGQPIASVGVRLQETALAAIAGSDGRYRIPDVPTGTYTLSARQVGYQKITKSVTVADGEVVTVDLAMTRSPTILDLVVTTGTVIPTSVKALPSPISVITADQIEQQQPFTLAAILRQAVPNTAAFNSPGAPENTLISLRGASSLLSGGGNVKVFVDGIDAANSTVAPVDPENIARIEVARGPQASTIYGADAAGGVVQIFTKRGELGLRRPHLDARVMLGLAQTPYSDFKSVMRQEYTGSVRGGDSTASYNFGGGYTRLANYVPDNGETRQSNPRVYGATQFVRGILTADLSARYNHNEVPVTENPIVRTSGYLPESRPLYVVGGFGNETYGARLTVTPAGWWSSRITIGVDRNTVRNVQTEPRLTAPDDTLLSLYDYRSRKLSVGFSSTITGSFHPDASGSITLGIDHYSLDGGTFYTSQALNSSGDIETLPPGGLSQSFDRANNTGYFAQTQLSVRDAIFFTAGVRAEANSSFGSEYGTVVLPRIGLSLVDRVGTASVKLRGSYGKAFRAPSPGLASGLVSANDIRLANPQLAPERQQGWDAGFDLIFGNAWSLAVTGFDQTATDLIAFLQVGATPLPTSQYRNIGRVSNKGIELEGTLTLAHGLRLAAQYGFVRSRIEAVGSAGGQVEAGDEPLGVPAHTAGATLTVTPHTGTTLAAGMTYVGGYRQLDAMALYRCVAAVSAENCPSSFLQSFSFRGFVAPYSGFAKVNATITHRITSHLEAVLSIDNLTNEEVNEPTNSVPVIGRTTMLGFHLSY